MTYLVYALWFLSLLWAAAEVDRLYTGRIAERLMPELSSGTVWFLSPAVSMVLPGAGQFLNGQVLKGLLCFAWPIVISASHAVWPWQFMHLYTWQLLLAWYPLVVLDALAAGLLHHRRHAKAAAALEAAEALDTRRDDLSDFLARRQARQNADR
jgi:TM2 domain-containing membrane protein YozV